MNNSVRGLFRYIIVISILTLFSLLTLSIHYVPVIAQTSEVVWNSFTLQRVNLRETPSIRSTILTVLDEGTVVTVVDEVPQDLLERAHVGAGTMRLVDLNADGVSAVPR